MMAYMSPWKRLCTKSMVMPIAACALLQFSTVYDSEVHAQGLFDDFPVVISCEYKGMQHAYYLSRVTPEGLATYVSSDSMAGTVSLDGKAKAVGGSNAGTCVGKTLEQLRASGQAHDLKR